MVGKPIRQVTSTARKKPRAPPVTIAFVPASENFPLTDCSSEIFTAPCLMLIVLPPVS